MPVVRVYVPLGGARLGDLAGRGALPASLDAPVEAFAVTDELTAQSPGLDEEGLEYAAFVDAVAAAGGLRLHRRDRRLVIAADVDPEALQPGDGTPLSAILLVADLPVSRIASLHVDEAGQHPAAAPDEAGSLLWYDVTELREVVRFFPGPDHTR
ncbi:MAG: hypothetical protein L0H79_07415 [Intrasporangium sp.]|uniref:DUF6912 family protein n=1 Tax=Intrasporangium sp. TaxID=1925024 RepID=UPI0026475477|nr:hypothetical protein [Intrasporangium sp.]MDN5795567.1 hypothetical protein [Intrasporangium sp.]